MTYAAAPIIASVASAAAIPMPISLKFPSTALPITFIDSKNLTFSSPTKSIAIPPTANKATPTSAGEILFCFTKSISFIKPGIKRYKIAARVPTANKILPADLVKSFKVFFILSPTLLCSSASCSAFAASASPPKPNNFPTPLAMALNIPPPPPPPPPPVNAAIPALINAGPNIIPNNVAPIATACRLKNGPT